MGKPARLPAGRQPALKDLLLPPQVPKGTDVGDGEGYPELVFRAYLSEGNAPVFERQPAAVTVVGHLRNLVLQRGVLNVVAHPAREVEAFAVEGPVPDEGPDLVGKRLQNR